VAGEGAIAGYLGAYIDADARRLIPLAGVIVLLVIVVAFRRLVPALLAFAIVLAAVFGSLGTMSLTGVPFYVITNALPVILVGISVADAIHILGRYEELRTESTDSTRQQLVVRTMCDMWRPVTATSLTTAAGFLGLYFASDMPPFRYFGLFAALGVMVAWFYSIFFLPAAMTLLEFRDNASRTRGGAGRDTFSVLMQALGHFTLSRPVMIIGIFAVLAVAGASAALQLQVDGDRISLFDQREPIRRADAAINKHLYGTNTLDIVVESVAPEGLLEPVNLRRIEALQRYVESLPHVTGSSSIVDYLKQMNRAMRGGEAQAYALPESSAMAAQYFLVYSMSSDPSDFEEEIDYDYRVANVRVTLNSGRYRDIGPVVNAIETYIEDEFNTDQISATQSGRVNLNYHWLKSVGESHFAGLVTSLLLVYCVAALLYRSPVAGVYALIPVCSSVLCVYAFMVVSGMTLEIGTSMFAAVSIGLGVDFAIHTLDRMRVLHKETGGDMPRMYKSFFCSTGRALLFNALAIACGFGVLVFSKVSQLSDFGSVVVLSMFVSFVASMTLVPALLLLLRPKFLASGSVR
jgi:predicted RND superfamily exporter protein